jgi:CO/xanthine dehydrogenase Mo-binding subunit
MSETTIAPATVEIKAPEKKWAGQSIPRKEDKRLTQGEGVFVDDVKRHGMGFIHFVRSPYAHAHITSIDVSKAEEIKGVYETFTGAEVAEITDPFFQLATPRRAGLRARAGQKECATPARPVVADRRAGSMPTRATHRCCMRTPKRT